MFGMMSESDPTLPPGYVPNEKIRARLDGLSPEDVQCIEIVSRKSRSHWKGSQEVSDQPSIEEIFNAFKTSCRWHQMSEELHKYKMDHDSFTFHVLRGSSKDQVFYRVYSETRWGPALTAI